ncbi:MAG: hypothetical protein K0R38_5798, partial [Polyangiaceae bacterium]|nr:hypothetical protein [Polyangiaceae bacterium]
MSGYGSYGSGLGRWAGAAVLAAAYAVACGDGFKSSDCKATRTCPAPPQGGEAGEGAGSTSNNESGAGGLGEGGSMGGEGGAQLPKPECTAAVDCDNADATDGAEACVDGACRPGDAPPRVVSVSPAHEGKDAEPNVPVVIEFSEALDPDSFMSDRVQLLDGSEPVPGELKYENGVATFVPERALRLHGSYEVVVSASVTDEAGIELVEPFRSTFTVRDGSWHLTEIPVKFSELALQAPLTASGSVLLGWVGNGTNTCPVAAGWLELGADQITPTTFAHSASSCGAPLVAASGNSAVFAWNADGSSYLQQYRSSEWAKEATQATTNTQSWVAAVATSPLGVVSRFELANRVGGVRAQRTDETGAWQPAREELVALDLRISSGLDVAFDAEGNGLA